MPQEKKLLDIVREKLRIKHYSYQTEKTYIALGGQVIVIAPSRFPTPSQEASVRPPEQKGGQKKGDRLNAV